MKKIRSNTIILFLILALACSSLYSQSKDGQLDDDKSNRVFSGLEYSVFSIILIVISNKLTTYIIYIVLHQILTAIFLERNYKPSSQNAFESIENIKK